MAEGAQSIEALLAEALDDFDAPPVPAPTVAPSVASSATTAATAATTAAAAVPVVPPRVHGGASAEPLPLPSTEEELTKLLVEQLKMCESSTASCESSTSAAASAAAAAAAAVDVTDDKGDDVEKTLRALAASAEDADRIVRLHWPALSARNHLAVADLRFLRLSTKRNARF